MTPARVCLGAACTACATVSLLLLVAVSLSDRGEQRPAAEQSCAVGRLASQLAAVQQLVQCHIRLQRQQFPALNRTLRLLRLNSSSRLLPGCRLGKGGQPPGQLLAPLFSSQLLRRQSRSVDEFLRFVAGTFPSDTAVNQTWTPSTERKLRRYTDYLRATRIMRDLYETLGNNALLPGNQTYAQFIDATLYRLWFTMYGRRRRQEERGFTNSCGYEHVFAGERRAARVLGFHSWLRLLAEEEAGRLRYRGHYGLQTGPLPVISVCFDWHNATKGVGTLLLGVQPEFDLLLYTATHLLRPNGVAKLLLPDGRLYVQNFANDFANYTVHAAFPLLLPDRRLPR